MKKFIILFMQWLIPCLLVAQSGDFCNFYIRSGFDSECIITSYKPGDTDPLYDEHKCMVACRGSQVIYSIVGLPSGASYDWAVSGADSYTTNTSDNTITVNWSGNAGIGTLILSVYGPNDEFCEKQLCVDLIERPIAGIISNPTETGYTPSGIQYIDVCDGQEIQFYDNSTSVPESPIVGYYWRVGNQTSAMQNFSFTADYTLYGGTTTIVHRVVNECGCEDSVMYIVNISSYPTLEVDCFGTACENTTATYHAVNSCSDYLWYVEGGHIQSGQGTSSLTVMWDDIDDGYGYIALNGVSCGQTCPSLTYLPIPVISDNAEIQGPDVVCVDDIVYFELPLWASTEYNWSIVYTNPSDVRVLFSGHRHKYLVEFRNPGTYTIKCIYNCGFLGCGGVAQAKTVVVTKPFNIIADREACAGESVTFETDYPTEVFDWTIYHNGTAIYTQTASTISYTFNTAGGYTIEASSPNFCNTAYASININALPPAPQPDVSGWRNIVCLNSGYTYSATPPSPEYYLHWSTSCGDPSEYDGNDYNVTFQSLPCTVNLQYVNRNTGCSSLPYQYQVTQFVPQTINWPTYEVCANEIFTMQAPIESEVQFEWYVQSTNNANIVSDWTANIVDVQVNAYYGPMIVLLNRKYCNNISKVDTIPITVKPYLIPEISMPSSICQYGTAVISADNPDQFNGIWTMNVEGSSYNYTGLTSGATWQHTFNNAGTIPVRMGYRTPGCTNVYENVETIEVIPAPQFSLSYYDQSSGNYLINATIMAPNATGYTYAWNPNVSTDPYFTHYGATFNYTCTVTDIATGCTNSKNISQSSSDIPCPDPGVNCTNPDGGGSVVLTSRNCNSITFTHNSALGGNSAWTFFQNASSPQFTLSGTNNSVCTATFSSSGYYRVVAGRIYNNCMYTADLQFCVPMIARLKVGYSCATGTGINLELEDISDYMSGTVINSTAWYVDGILVSNPSSYAVTSGTHTVMLTVNYTYGNITESCSTTQTVTYNRGTAAFTVSAGPYCSETGIQFTDNSTNAIAWHWQFSDESFNMNHNYSRNPEHTFENSNNSNAIPALIVLESQDNLGCYSNAYNTLQINPNTLKGTLGSQQTSVCYGNPWQLSLNHTVSPTANPVYQWYNTNQTTYTYSNNFYESGLYYVRVTNNNGCIFQSNWYGITFNSSPVAEIYGDADYCPDGEITLMGDSGDNTYQWTGIGSYPITTPNLTATIASYALSPGNYTVTLTVTNNGCSSTDTKTITIHPTPATPSIGFGTNRCLHIPPVNLISTTSQNLNWSTGDFGTATETYNSGFHTAYYTDPTTGCRSAEAEIDVPKPPDFNELMSGCFEFCKDDFSRFLLGPSGEFDYWYWYYYNTVIDSDNGSIPSLEVPTYGTYHLDVDYASFCSTASGNLVVSQKEVCDSCDLVVSLLKEPWCDVKDCKLRVFFYLNIYNPALNSATLYGVNSPNIGTLYSPVLPVTINPGTTATLLFEIELANYEPQDMYLQLLFYDGHFHPCDYDFFVDISDVLDNCISQNCSVKVGQFEYLGSISSAGMAYFGYHFFMSMGLSNVLLYSDDVTIIDVNYNPATGEISGVISITPLELQQLIAENKTICFKLYACYKDKICKLEFCVPASNLQIIGSKSVSAEDDTETETGEVPNMDEPLSPLTPDFCLYPNPATSSVSISGDNFSRATVIDLGGKVVMEVYDTTFNIGTLRNGEYIVKVVSLDGAIQYLKLIKR